MYRLSAPVAFVAALSISHLAVGAHPDSLPATPKQQHDWDKIETSLQALTRALNHIAEEKGRQPFANTINQSATAQAEKARRELAAGHPDLARAELDQAMLTVKTAIATLRHRETLVRSLNFETPADEYLYELDRFQTYHMLVNLLLERMRPDPGKRAHMEERVLKASDREQSARALADNGDFNNAIREQEASNKLLLQAIRRGGIYVPG